MAIIDKRGFMRGKLGNFTYYVRNGKQYRRSRPVKNADNPSDNNARKPYFTEFSAVSKAARHLRIAIFGAPGIQIHQVTHAQRVGFLIRVTHCDPAAPGSRTVVSGLQTEKGKAIFAAHIFRWKRTTAIWIYKAVAKNQQIEILPSAYHKKVLDLIHLQINLNTGDFKRKIHRMPVSHDLDHYHIPQSFRRKKNHVQLLFIAGNKTLQGVVVEREEP